MGKVQITFKNYKNSQKIAEYALLFLISAIFLTLFSLWTSPFYKDWYGCDASFFTLVGRGMLNGKVMYRDFYDLKGPYFFFLEALGQLFVKGRTGAFLIQLIALYASVILIWNICLLFVNKAKSAFILGVFYICHIATLWGGNTLEEMFLPLSLLCLYLTCRLLCVKAEGGHSLPGFSTAPLSLPEIPMYLPAVLGACFGVMIFSKISIAGCVLGITAAIGFLMLTGKDYKGLAFFILYFILGLLLASLPVFVYFSMQGCLTDMINCVFVVGFRRSKDFAEAFNLTWELKCSGVILSFVFAVTHRKRAGYPLCVILMAMSAATYILLHLGTPFYYYFTSGYPCIVLTLCLMLSVYDPLIMFESPKQAVCLILFGIYLLYYIPASLGTVRTVLYDRNNDSSYETYVSDSQELASFIPQFERDEVFSFMLDMQWYEINGILPCNRYVVNLPFFLVLDENALPELTEYLNDTPPKWLVIGHDFDANLPEIAAIVRSKYSPVCENSVGELYLLDE